MLEIRVKILKSFSQLCEWKFTLSGTIIVGKCWPRMFNIDASLSAISVTFSVTTSLYSIDAEFLLYGGPPATPSGLSECQPFWWWCFFRRPGHPTAKISTVEILRKQLGRCFQTDQLLGKSSNRCRVRRFVVQFSKALHFRNTLFCEKHNAVHKAVKISTRVWNLSLHEVRGWKADA